MRHDPTLSGSVDRKTDYREAIRSGQGERVQSGVEGRSFRRDLEQSRRRW
jgi:hypothetical protein